MVVGDLGQASEAKERGKGERPFQWVKLPEELGCYTPSLGHGNPGTARSLFCPEQVGHRGMFYRDRREI